MREQEVRKILKHVRYKPGFKFSIDNGDIEVLLVAPNAYGRGTAEARAYVTRERYLGIHVHVKDVVKLIADAVWRLENHEYAEWFKYKGRRLYDPNH